LSRWANGGASMKLGVAYPSTEVAGDPQALRRFIGAIDALGYDHLMAPDHILKAPRDERDPPLNGPYTEKDSFPDPFVLFGFGAALTDRLEFVTGVLVLPQRQTALVAQQAADIDLLSQQRLRLGIGIGWNYVEYAGLGQDFRARAKRIEEQIDLLRALWSTPVVSFEGRFDRIDRAGINPRPRRQIPIWLGGHSEAAYERAARLADGFIFADGKAAVEAWGRVRHHLGAMGQDENRFGRELFTQFAVNPVEAADQLKRWRDAGGTHGSITSTNKGLRSDIEAHIDYVSEVKRLMGE
jgi:probable F420-dependent oxidoreductase